MSWPGEAALKGAMTVTYPVISATHTHAATRLCPAPENKDYFFKAGDPVWKHLPVISAPGKVKQEDLDFETSLSYISRSCLKNERQWKKGKDLCSTPALGEF